MRTDRRRDVAGDHDIAIPDDPADLGVRYTTFTGDNALLDLPALQLVLNAFRSHNFCSFLTQPAWSPAVVICFVKLTSHDLHAKYTNMFRVVKCNFAEQLKNSAYFEFIHTNH